MRKCKDLFSAADGRRINPAAILHADRALGKAVILVDGRLLVIRVSEEPFGTGGKPSGIAYQVPPPGAPAAPGRAGAPGA